MFPSHDRAGVTIMTMDCLEKMWKKAKGKHREHVVTHYMEKHRYNKKKHVYLNNDISHYRLTLDYREDYELIKIMYNHLKKYDMYFGLLPMVEFLSKYPEIGKINNKHKRNSGYYECYN